CCKYPCTFWRFGQTMVVCTSSEEDVAASKNLTIYRNLKPHLKERLWCLLRYLCLFILIS
ncbi:MAG TPA: hypothetical protein VE619_02565, partial [Nitrososphaeraceae archaeon]|nr:hypothetical protein [Nitrososphaeraceae archaeon]